MVQRIALLAGLLVLLVAAPPALAQDVPFDSPVPVEFEPEAEQLEGSEEEVYEDPFAPDVPAVANEAPDTDWLEPWTTDGQQQPDVPAVELVTTATVAGRVAMLRADGRAAIPRGAPKRVRAVIRAGNQIAGKPYKWGGGHAKLVDRGYDCSGAVGYALIRAGPQTAPMTSGQFARWGAAGAGRWMTIYANKGHVYMEIAGLRLDTSTAGYGEKGVRWRPVTGKRRGFKVRHVAGL